MITNTLKFTPLQNTIIRILCIKAGTSINQRELSRLTYSTPSGVAKALKHLEQNNICKITKNSIMNLNLVTLNRTSETLQLKQLENIKQLYELPLIETLEETFPGTTIILFGSYFRGEDTIHSDIDIAIIGYKEKIINTEIFEKILERPINITFFHSFKDIQTELKENLFNGLVLVGGITLCEQ